MSTKKTVTKTIKPAAPAVSTFVTAAKPAVKKVTTPVVAPVHATHVVAQILASKSAVAAMLATKPAVAAVLPPKPAFVAPTPVKPAAAPVKKPAPTVITAQVDVGFGNTLYLRGDGPGLSWEKGVSMDCASDEQWTISIHNAIKPVVFKFLLNDVTWCAGDDFTVTPGSSITVTPTF